MAKLEPNPDILALLRNPQNQLILYGTCILQSKLNIRTIIVLNEELSVFSRLWGLIEILFCTKN